MRMGRIQLPIPKTPRLGGFRSEVSLGSSKVRTAEGLRRTIACMSQVGDDLGAIPEPVLPAADDVKAELLGLRKRAGFSPAKLRTEGQLLKSLPVVDDQMALQRQNPQNRHLAAYKVVGCAIDSISNLLWRKILILSLPYNFKLLKTEEQEGWENVLKASSETARDDLARSIVMYEKTQYFEHLGRAYDELSGLLVMLSESPCRRPEPTELQYPSISNEQILSFALSCLTVETKQHIRQLLSKDILDFLITGSTGRRSDVATARTEIALNSVLRYVLDRTYDTQVDAYVTSLPLWGDETVLAAARAQIASKDALSAILLESCDSHLLVRIEDEAAGEFSVETPRWARSARYNGDKLATSIDILAYALKGAFARVRPESKTDPANLTPVESVVESSVGPYVLKTRSIGSYLERGVDM